MRIDITTYGIYKSNSYIDYKIVKKKKRTDKEKMSFLIYNFSIYEMFEYYWHDLDLTNR